MSGTTGKESLVGLVDVQSAYDTVVTQLRRFRGAMSSTSAGKEIAPPLIRGSHPAQDPHLGVLDCPPEIKCARPIRAAPNPRFSSIPNPTPTFLSQLKRFSNLPRR